MPPLVSEDECFQKRAIELGISIAKEKGIHSPSVLTLVSNSIASMFFLSTCL